MSEKLTHAKGEDAWEWLRHPYTRRTLRKIRERKKTVEDDFRAAVRATMDVNVARLFEELESLEHQESYFSGGALGGETDAEDGDPEEETD